MTRKQIFAFLALVCALILAACGGTGDTTPEEPQLVTAIVTPPTATPVIPTSVPTATFTPLPPLTATPSPTPTYDPGEAAAPYDLGNRAYAEGNYATAVTEYTKALSLRSDFVDAYYNRGLAFAALGRIEESLEDLSKTLELESFRADAHVARARVYLEAENVQAAFRDLEQAIAAIRAAR
jgi:Flp pilus assembly protein TadD